MRDLWLVTLMGCLPKVSTSGLEHVQVLASNVPIVGPYRVAGPPVSTVQCEGLAVRGQPKPDLFDMQDVLGRLAAGHDAIVQVSIHRRVERWYTNEFAALDPGQVEQVRVCYAVSAIPVDFVD